MKNMTLNGVIKKHIKNDLKYMEKSEEDFSEDISDLKGLTSFDIESIKNKLINSEEFSDLLQELINEEINENKGSIPLF